jgi:hypothetical protein
MSAPLRVTARFETVPGLGATFREVGSGASSGSNEVSTSGALAAAQSQLYLAAVATHPYVEVVEVSGLGLAWSPVFAQCSGRNQTGVSVWRAQGTPDAQDAVVAGLAGLPAGAVLAVSRYTGAAQPDPIGNLVTGNTNGVAGACTGGSDGNRYAFPLTTLDSGSTVYVAAAMRSRSHSPGSQFEERAELQVGIGGTTTSLAVADASFGFPGTKSVDGRFSNDVDWAVVALEIRRSEQPPRTSELTVETSGAGGVIPPGGTYDAGSVLTLTALPEGGSAFAEWRGDLTGTTNPATLSLDTDKSVTAVFLAPEPPEALRVAVAGLAVALAARAAGRRSA